MSLVGVAPLSCACALIAAAPAAGANGTEFEREESPVASAAPDRAKVTETFVRIHDPLPDSGGPHPEACDWITYLRFRNADGPASSADADAVITIIPGFLGGASSFDQLARNTVRNAAARGRDVEFWALDRRANCLEDHTGVHAAAAERDASIAWQYYWGDREIAGRRFGGFHTADETGWLREVGLRQTMEDWYTVLRKGIPSRRGRARKVICGGHSMGGPLTALFASWDFDGDPATRDDAGYRQCAGFVGLDTRLAIGRRGGVTSATGALIAASTARGSPFLDTAPLTPETIQVPAVFGVGSFLAPEGTDLLDELPRTANIDLAQRFLFSKDAAHFASGVPSIRDFTITNELTLAGVFDENSAPLTFMRTSLGFVTGGELADKNFPSPDPTLALPEEPDTPLYSWQTYEEVGAGEEAVLLNDDGTAPYTARGSEVSDLREFARTMFEAPANFIEQYFPTRLLTDLEDVGEGNREGDLAHIQHEGIPKRDAILINAAESDDNEAVDEGKPFREAPPNERPGSRTVVIPGYNHLDVLTAARAQNDGRPEPSAKALSGFTLRILKGQGHRKGAP